jgi:hypothetical protein
MCWLRHHNLMVVSDDTQSIYAARRQLPKHPAISPTLRSSHIQKVRANYRSTPPEILNVANAAIGITHNSFRRSRLRANLEFGRCGSFAATRRNRLVCGSTRFGTGEEGMTLDQMAAFNIIAFSHWNCSWN